MLSRSIVDRKHVTVFCLRYPSDMGSPLLLSFYCGNSFFPMAPLAIPLVEYEFTN